MFFRLIALLLVLSLPVQALWAAAGSFCAHEQGVETKHFGHHAHQHQGEDAGGVDSGDTRDPPTGEFHPDCEACHSAGSVSIPVGSASQFIVNPPSQFSERPLRFRSHIPLLPERPDRLTSCDPVRFADGAAIES